jgi:hypothetical protein
MNDKSWRVDSFQEGKYKISVRKNLENDRVDEGDYPESGLKRKANKDEDE